MGLKSNVSTPLMAPCSRMKMHVLGGILGDAPARAISAARGFADRQERSRHARARELEERPPREVGPPEEALMMMRILARELLRLVQFRLSWFVDTCEYP